METNKLFLRLAITMIIIFGGVFTIHYFRSGELLIDQFIGLLMGVMILIGSLLWRKKATVK